jgi:hypothetical protein
MNSRGQAGPEEIKSLVALVIEPFFPASLGYSGVNPGNPALHRRESVLAWRRKRWWRLLVGVVL